MEMFLLCLLQKKNWKIIIISELKQKNMISTNNWLNNEQSTISHDRSFYFTLFFTQ